VAPQELAGREPRGVVHDDRLRRHPAATGGLESGEGLEEVIVAAVVDDDSREVGFLHSRPRE